MQSGSVSVVIPTYNRRRTICRAIDSVLAQDYPSLEVIVVDDGSTDGTQELIRDAFGNDPRVIYVHQPNGGVCVARNAGMAHARGEFVAMLDSDDTWLPGKLRTQVDVLRRHPELSLVWTDMAAIDSKGEILWPQYLRRFYSTFRFFPQPLDLFTHERTTAEGVRYWTGEIAHAMLLGNLIHTSTMVARSDRLAVAGHYDQACHPAEDQDYYFRVCKTGPVALIDAVTVRYTVGEDDAASGSRMSRVLSVQSLAVMKKNLGAEPELARSLPEGFVERALSGIYAWAGYAHFNEDRMAEARTYLWKRLRSAPTDTNSIKYLAASFLPRSVFRLLRSRPRWPIVCPGLLSVGEWLRTVVELGTA